MTPSRVKILLLALAAGFMAAVAMWPAARNGFVWDDIGYIHNNPLVKNISVHGVKNILTTPHEGLYKPVVMLSLALDYKIARENARVYHITNILLHAANAILVFALVFLLVKNHAAAFLCAALFAVHPMHVESVAWISERKDMLYALFFLLSSVFYIKFAETRVMRWLLGSLACFLLSLCAKPMGITLPLILFVYDYLLGRPLNRRLVYEKLPHMALAVVFGTVTVILLRSAGQARDIYTFSERALLAFYGLWFYIAKLVWPANLSSFYPLPLNPESLIARHYWQGPVIALAAGLVLFKFFRSNRLVVGGATFYALAVLPVLQVMCVGPVITADRYSYIPALGLFLPLAVYTARGLTILREKSRAFAGAAMACVAVLLLVMTAASRARCAVWKDNNTLFADALEKNRAATVRVYYGWALMDYGDTEGAVKVFGKLFETAGPLPYSPAAADRVFMLCAGFIDTLKASGNETLGLELEPKFEKFAAEFPPVLMKTARTEIEKGELAKALTMLDRAARYPNYRAEAFFQQGEVFLMTEDFDRARAAFEEARRFNPDLPPADQLLPPLEQAAYAGMRNMPNGSGQPNERGGRE